MQEKYCFDCSINIHAREVLFWVFYQYSFKRSSFSVVADIHARKVLFFSFLFLNHWIWAPQGTAMLIHSLPMKNQMLGLWHIWYFCHTRWLTLFLTLLVQAAGHNNGSTHCHLCATFKEDEKKNCCVYFFFFPSLPIEPVMVFQFVPPLRVVCFNTAPLATWPETNDHKTGSVGSL